MIFDKNLTYTFLLSSIVTLGGCVTPQTNNPDSTGNKLTAYSAARLKAGLCKMPFTFEQATKYVGIDPTLSPEDRQIEKRKVWDEWLERQATYKAGAIDDTKEYSVHHAVVFYSEGEEKGVVSLYPSGVITDKASNAASVYKSAIPDSLLVNYGTYFVDLRLPIGLVDLSAHEPRKSNEVFTQVKHNYDLHRRIFNGLEYKHYGNKSRAPEHIYVINTVYHQKSAFQIVEGSYTGGVGPITDVNGKISFYGDNTMYGVHLNVSDWHKHSKIINKRHDGTFTFDYRDINFFEKFGYYPDAANPVIYITYRFTISDCDANNDLNGKLKEVGIYSRSGVELERVRLQ